MTLKSSETPRKQWLTQGLDEAFCPWPGSKVQSTVQADGGLGGTWRTWGGNGWNRALTMMNEEKACVVSSPCEVPFTLCHHTPVALQVAFCQKFSFMALYTLNHNESTDTWLLTVKLACPMSPSWAMSVWLSPGHHWASESDLSRPRSSGIGGLCSMSSWLSVQPQPCSHITRPFGTQRKTAGLLFERHHLFLVSSTFLDWLVLMNHFTPLFLTSSDSSLPSFPNGQVSYVMSYGSYVAYTQRETLPPPDCFPFKKLMKFSHSS